MYDAATREPSTAMRRIILGAGLIGFAFASCAAASVISGRLIWF